MKKKVTKKKLAKIIKDNTKKKKKSAGSKTFAAVCLFLFSAQLMAQTISGEEVAASYQQSGDVVYRTSAGRIGRLPSSTGFFSMDAEVPSWTGAGMTWDAARTTLEVGDVGAPNASLLSAVGNSGVISLKNPSGVGDQFVGVAVGAHSLGARVCGVKHRAASGTAPTTIVVDGDSTMTIAGYGATGAAFAPVGSLDFQVDGTPGVGDMPGRFVLSLTQDGQASPTEQLRIGNGGAWRIYNTSTAGGTTGAQTINRPTGSVNFAAAATTLVVTNSLVTASSYVFATILTNDTTALIKNVVPAAGSFTIRLNAAATAETKVAFFVIN